MQRKILLVLNYFLKIITIIGTLLFMIMNFENITCYFSCEFDNIIEPEKSISAKYPNWLNEIYGEKEGGEIYWKIVDFTERIINHHINLILFLLISIAMIICLYLDKKLNGEINKKLKLFFIIGFIIMLIATFVAGPAYEKLMFE